MTNILTIVGQITGAWTTATELAPLLLVPALVWGIRTALEIADRLAIAARWTYRAGRFTGRLWFRADRTQEPGQWAMHAADGQGGWTPLLAA